MTHQQLENLLFRYQNGLCSAQEMKAVELWLQHRIDSTDIHLQENELSAIGGRMRQRIFDETKPNKSFYLYGVASLLAVACLVLFFIRFPFSSIDHNSKLMPGKNRALLTLYNGRDINLDTIPLGHNLAMEGLEIKKAANGEVIYQIVDNGNTGINLLRVPKGGKFKVILADSSVVWLNSDTELRYPTSFSSNSRIVSLSGEGFFEVYHDSNRPFIVETDLAKVKVLGTGFNIRSYKNDSDMEASVIHGSILVYNDKQRNILHKNDKIKVGRNGLMTVGKEMDKASVAWKEGMFHFDGMPMGEIAKQIARWYDIQVEVDSDAWDLELYGVIPQRETANQVFEILEATKLIKVKILHNKVIITKR